MGRQALPVGGEGTAFQSPCRVSEGEVTGGIYDKCLDHAWVRIMKTWRVYPEMWVLRLQSKRGTMNNVDAI